MTFDLFTTNYAQIYSLEILLESFIRFFSDEADTKEISADYLDDDFSSDDDDYGSSSGSKYNHMKDEDDAYDDIDDDDIETELGNGGFRITEDGNDDSI